MAYAAFVLCRHGQASEKHDARRAGIAQTAQERKHRWLGHRPATKWGWLNGESTVLKGLFLEVCTDLSDERLYRMLMSLGKSRSGHRLSIHMGSYNQWP